MRFIAHGGVDTVSGRLFVTYGLFDALHGAQPQVRTIGARHEQGCSYMAWVRARRPDRRYAPWCPPGLLNASAGLLTAWARISRCCA